MLVLLSGLAAASGLSMVQAIPTENLFEDLDLSDLSLQAGHERTFVSLNSTYIAYGVAAGAVLVLVLAVGLYLYDYYYGTSRSDPVPPTQTDYSQYYTDQESYNQYLYQQAAENYRYFSIMNSPCLFFMNILQYPTLSCSTSTTVDRTKYLAFLVMKHILSSLLP